MYSLLAFLSSILNIILNIIFIAVLKIGLNGLFLAYIISSILVGIYGLWQLKAHHYIKFNNKITSILNKAIKE